MKMEIREMKEMHNASIWLKHNDLTAASPQIVVSPVGT